MSIEKAGLPGLAEMVRLATIPAAQLLAETRSALLLVDVENRFIFGSDPASPVPTARVMPPLGKLIRTARTHAVPCFFVTQGHVPGPSDSASQMRRLNEMGVDAKGRLRQAPLSAWACGIPSEIAPQPGEIHLTKWRFSAFYETGLDTLLRGAGVETVVLGGVSSYACIIATYIDAFSRGFFPLLCTEAVDGREPTMHKAAMDYMGPSRLAVDEIVGIWSKEV
jgi:nicotinamidase-related amidase